MSRQNCEQHPDFFENIDNIDVNIEETFSVNQQQLYIQNFSNLGNLSQLRFQRGIGSQNRSNRRNRLGTQPSAPIQHEQVSNIMLSGLEGSFVNRSFSQLSQFGENLADTREQENEINQIRISNRNLTNHQLFNHSSSAMNLAMQGPSQRALNDQRYQREFLNAPSLHGSR